METVNLKDLLESNGFIQTGTENGTPVYSIEKEKSIKEQIIEIIGFGMEPERAELKAKELIIIFNAHLLEKAKESHTLTELLEKTFIYI